MRKPMKKSTSIWRKLSWIGFFLSAIIGSFLMVFSKEWKMIWLGYLIFFGISCFLFPLLLLITDDRPYDHNENLAFLNFEKREE